MSSNGTDLRIEFVQEAIEDLMRNHDIVTRGNNSIATRLVWFVAIAGFALLNVPDLATSLSGTSMSGTMLLLLMVPWAAAAIFGVIGHWQLGVVSFRDAKYFNEKRARLNLFRMARASSASYEECQAIMEDQDEHLRDLFRRLRRSGRWATVFEQATLVAVCIAFVWSIVFPLAA